MQYIRLFWESMIVWPRIENRFCLSLFVCGALSILGIQLEAEDVGARIESETGGHTRMVWVQDQSRAQNDTLARDRNLMLVGFDSRDGKGERPILRGSRNYVKPLMTPTGERVVYSDHFLDRVFVVDWDGGNRRTLCAGFALDVWQDPEDGTQWVYAARRVGTVTEFVYRDVFRVQLDDPRVREPVWNATQISPDNFQLSEDGLKAAGEFPWPNSGLADLATSTWEKRSTGCWASLAPDNSYVCAVFDGPHRNWQLHSADASRAWKVGLAPEELFEGFEVFHPRWSNHVRFIALTGPYKIRGPINEISGGGPEVEVYLAKFSENFDRIESWIRVTNNQRADFYPDVWIEGGDQTTIGDSISGRSQGVAGRSPPAGQADHPSTDLDRDLVFRWDSADRQNEVPGESGARRSCRIEPRGLARFDSFFALRTGAGYFQPDESSALAIKNVLSDNVDFSLEFVLTAEEVLTGGKSKCVLELGLPGGGRVSVQQRQNALGVVVVDSEATRAIKVADLTLGQPLHMALASKNDVIDCWSNANLIQLEKSSVRLEFADSPPARLTLGADLLGDASWNGRLERLRFYRRALTPSEVLSHSLAAQESLRGRTAPSRKQVRAELVQSTPAPVPESLLPYRRALCVHHFRLQSVLAGEFDDQEFLVARWAVLDGQAVAGAVPEPGAVLDLWLESFDEQPQLTSERQLIEVDRIELSMFYDVSFPP